MKSRQPISAVLITLLFLSLGACVGGGALEGGGSGASLDDAGTGQGQPTIQPGADHQPGTPIEPDPDKSASDDIAIPPPPPPTDEPKGPGDLTL